MFVKICEKELADLLIDEGFAYMTESNKDKTIFVFEATSKLLNKLQSADFNKEIILENKLRF